MSEYFILPSVSTRLLLLEGVTVPESFATLDRRASTTSGLCNGCFLGALFLSEDGEELRSGSWFFGGRNAHGSSPGSCDDSGIDLFRGLR